MKPENRKRVDAAVAALRAKGIGKATIVDTLIARYCSHVAREAGLNGEQKRPQVRRFAAGRSGWSIVSKAPTR